MDGQDDEEEDSYSFSDNESSSEESLPPIIVAKKPAPHVSSFPVGVATIGGAAATTGEAATVAHAPSPTPSQSKPSIKSSINSFFSLSSLTKPISLQKHKTVSLTSLTSLTSLSHPKKSITSKTPPLESKHDEATKPAKKPKPSIPIHREVEDPLKRVQEFVSKKENEMLKNQFVEESTASLILSRFTTFSIAVGL